MCNNRTLRHDEAAVLLVDGLIVRRQPITGKPLVHARRVQHLVMNAVHVAALERSIDDARTCRPNVEITRHIKQLFTRQLFCLAPQLVRTPQDRHVGRVLEIGQPDDAVDAV